MKSLREKQSRFAMMISQLIIWLCQQGYSVTFGDAYALTGHIKGSFHGKRLAIDINLFSPQGKYLTKTEDHAFIGKKWKSMHPDNTWGGDFKDKNGNPKPDGNHYSIGEK